MIRLALKAIMANATRSLHIIVTVALCVMIVFSSFSVANGLLLRFKSMTEGYNVTSLLFLLEKNKVPSESKLDEGIKLNNSNIQSTCPMILVKANISFLEGSMPIEVWGVSSSLPEVRPLKLKGSFFSTNEEAIVGVSLAKKLGLEIGHQILLESRSANTSVLITGIFESESSFDIGILTPLSTARILRPEMASSFSLIEIRVKDPKTVQSTANILSMEYPEMDVNLGMAMIEFIDLSSGDVVRDLWILSTIIFAVAVITVYHTMGCIVKESEWEIKVLRSLGAKRSTITKIFILEALILCFIGGMAGLCFGALLSNAAAITIFVIQQNYYVRPVFNLPLAVSCIALSMTASILGGILPAYRASKNVKNKLEFS